MAYFQVFILVFIISAASAVAEWSNQLLRVESNEEVDVGEFKNRVARRSHYDRHLQLPRDSSQEKSDEDLKKSGHQRIHHGKSGYLPRGRDFSIHSAPLPFSPILSPTQGMALPMGRSGNVLKQKKTLRRKCKGKGDKKKCVTIKKKNKLAKKHKFQDTTPISEIIDTEVVEAKNSGVDSQESSVDSPNGRAMEDTSTTVEPKDGSSESTTADLENGSTTEDPEVGSTTEDPEVGSTTKDPEDGSTTEDPEDGSTTEDTDDGSTTEDPEVGSTTEDPEDGSTTKDTEDGSTTEDPEDGSTTEDPEAGSTTEDTEDGSTTEEPDVGSTTSEDESGETTTESGETDKSAHPHILVS